MSFVESMQSLQGRLFRVVLVALVLSSVLLGAIFSEYQRRTAVDSLVEDMRVFGAILGNRSLAALTFNDASTAETNLAAARFNPSVNTICLYNASAQLFCEYHKSPDTMHCSPTIDFELFSEERIESNHLTVGMDIMDGSDLAGFVLITSNLHKIQVGQAKTVLVIGGSLVIVLLAVFFITQRTIRKQLHPLKTLNETAALVIDNAKTSKRAVKYSDDEVGELVDIFNLMLDNLAKERNALHESEQRFRTLAENIPIGIYLKDKDFNGIYANKSWTNLTRLPAECKRDEYLSHVDGDYLDVYKVMQSQVAEQLDNQVIEYQYVHPNLDEHKIFMEYVAPLRDEGNRLVGFVGSVVDATELKNAQTKLEKLAFYDPLTKLPNRRFFNDHLHFMIAASKRQQKGLAVLMLDLDHFKKANDSLGHAFGDKLLVAIADRIRKSIYSQDVVSRMGGDEFMILLTNIDHPDRVEKVASRILHEVSNAMIIDSHRVDSSVSIGIAMFPDDGDQPDILVRHADIALYHAKAQGRSRTAYFSRQLAKKLETKTRLEFKLRQAIEEDKLEIYLQPQWDLNSSCYYWAEVLLRWQDENEGFISPADFIPVAEETGLIAKLTDIVILKSLQLLSEHQHELTQLGIRGLSINLSAKQFFSTYLLQSLTVLLKRFDVPASKIELEITESLVMEDVDGAVIVLQRLRELGFRLSIDDFGTGYSSLNYLKKFPIDSLKIDQSFIRDIPEDKNDIEIASAIIAMAKKLGLKVVAEGVETSEQADFLVSQGCDFAQGYYFARPAPYANLRQACGFVSHKSHKN